MAASCRFRAVLGQALRRFRWSTDGRRFWAPQFRWVKMEAEDNKPVQTSLFPAGRASFSRISDCSENHAAFKNKQSQTLINSDFDNRYTFIQKLKICSFGPRTCGCQPSARGRCGACGEEVFDPGPRGSTLDWTQRRTRPVDGCRYGAPSVIKFSSGPTFSGFFTFCCVYFPGEFSGAALLLPGELELLWDK